jgi:predicted nucleic acid-binding protein
VTNSPICVDASVVIQLLVPPGGENVRTLWKQWVQTSRSLIAPSLLFYEVSNAFHQYRRAGQLSTQTVAHAMQAAQRLSIDVIDMSHAHGLALELCDTFGLTATYDAHYLVLAQQQGAEFWTLDKRLVARVQPKLSWVHLIE